MTREEMAAKGYVVDGNCFEVHAKFQQIHPNFTLCHSTVQHAIEPVRYAHCWLELNCMVLDISNGKTNLLPKDLYYAAGQINEDEVLRYTRMQAAKHMADTGKWGPWELESDL